MKDAAAAYLPTTSVAGTVCLIVAFIGLIACLMRVGRPRTNSACVAGLLIFFLAWLIECSAHMLVSYAHLPLAWRWYGIVTAAILFAGGLVTSLIGLIGISRNEHRYDHGFVSGVVGAGGNGWVVAAAIMVASHGQLRQLNRGMVIPINSAGAAFDEEEFQRRMALAATAGASDRIALQDLLTDVVARVLSIGAGADKASWREIAVGEEEPGLTADGEWSRLFFNPVGSNWLRLSVRRVETLAPEALQDQAAAGLRAALSSANDSEIRWSERQIAHGFDVCRTGYGASLPTLPGAHVFDRWLAHGHGWRVAVEQWMPATVQARNFRPEAGALARSVLAAMAVKAGRDPVRPLETRLLLEQARAAAQQRDGGAASAHFKRAAAQNPCDPEVVLEAAAGCEALAQPASALAILEQARNRLPPAPVLDASRVKLLATTTPGDPGVSSEFERLLQAGFCDDSTLATFLALLDTRHDPVAAVAVIGKYGAGHSRAMVAEWERHFVRPAEPPTPPDAAAPVAATAVNPDEKPPRDGRSAPARTKRRGSR